jgi:hypothetical protein
MDTSVGGQLDGAGIFSATAGARKGRSLRAGRGESGMGLVAARKGQMQGAAAMRTRLGRRRPHRQIFLILFLQSNGSTSR